MKVKDELWTELASASLEWKLDEAYDITVNVEGSKIEGLIWGKMILEAQDNEYSDGGVGVMIVSGSAVITQFDIGPVTLVTVSRAVENILSNSSSPYI